MTRNAQIPGVQDVSNLERYAMPIHEVIAILRSSSDDRAAAASTRGERRARRLRLVSDRTAPAGFPLATAHSEGAAGFSG